MTAETTTYTVAVVGTATEIGKTWAAVQLITAARQAGLTVAARKPAQSFDGGDLGRTDADQLAEASGEEPTTVCPENRWYPVPFAPPMASDDLGLPPIAIVDLLAEMTPSGAQLTVVETAGAVRSPIAHDGDCTMFVRMLRPDSVLLVANAGLGTISDVRGALDALHGLTVTVLLNRYDASVRVHELNRIWLVEREGCDVVTDVAQFFDRLRPSLPAPPDGGR